MESDDAAAPALSRRLATLAGLLVVTTVAWSTPAGRIGEDTKNDLYVDAWGLLRRALHLWDPQVTWGMLQNQGYGYLFPMGPFFALGSEVLPVWIVQRLWWTSLLVVGYLASTALLRQLRLGRADGHTPLVWCHLGALAYTLAPRVLSTMGAISPEAQTQLLAPLILWPLVAASAGRLGPRRAAALSALGVLLCGGVNATATILAAVPAGLWLVTRHRWWRAALTWWWAGLTAAAAAWWLIPLLLLGRFSPPFLNWIENAAVVAKPVGLLDLIKGTTHWLGHVVVLGGPWWPAGWAIASTPSIIVASSLIGALGLAGLAVPGAHRRFLLLSLVLGVVVLAVPHAGPLASPLQGTAVRLLDGPLAPLRNVHKADPLIRLPLVIGLVRLGAWLPLRRVRTRVGAALVVAASCLIVAGPAMSGSLTTRGTFTGMPAYWAQVGAWLSAHQREGGAVLVPSASFGEYTWGRTIDEPLRSLTTGSYAVRDAVPLTPAGTIRFLDELERRLQTGRDLDGAREALLSTGVRFVILRSDLDTELTGGPPAYVARSALRATPGVRLVAGFGAATVDDTGTRGQPVEIYALDGTAAAPLTAWPSASVPAVSGAAEALPALHESALVDGPVIFDGDGGAAAGAPRVETDTYRARHRWFGAVRGQDASRGLTASQDAGAPDYRPWGDESLRAVTAYDGIAGVAASSALSDDLTWTGLRPANRPYAALDADPSTAWLALGDPRPRLTITLPSAQPLDAVTITPVSSELQRRGAVAAARVRLTSGERAIESDLATGTPTRVPLPGWSGATLTVEILATVTGTPATTMTGFADVAISGVTPQEYVVLPAPRTGGPLLGMVLRRDPARFDECVLADPGISCGDSGFRAAEETSVLDRQFVLERPQTMLVSGQLTADPLASAAVSHSGSGSGTDPGSNPGPGSESGDPSVTVATSSTRSLGLPGAPEALLDDDPATAWSPAAGDDSPRITLTLAKPARLGDVRLAVRGDWLTENHPTVEVTRDGDHRFVRPDRDGLLRLPVVRTGSLVVRLLSDAGANASASLDIAALTVVGLDLPAASPSVDAACGAGPDFVVDGRPIPTRVQGDHRSLVGVGSLSWQACAPVQLSAGAHRIALGRWEGAGPVSIVVRSQEEAGASPQPGSSQPGSSENASSQLGQGVTIKTRAEPGGRLTAHLPAGPERLLVMTQNTNPGWEARLNGTLLSVRTVDGFRQGFVAPAGASGQLEIRFAPDGPYRMSLVIGLLLGLLIPAALVIPAGPARQLPAAAPLGRWAAPAAAITTGVVLAGGWGALLAAAALGIAGISRQRGQLVILAAGLVVLAGAIQAAFGTGGGSGPAWVEVGTRTPCLLALLIVLGTRPRKQGSLDEAIGHGRQPEGDRHPERE